MTVEPGTEPSQGGQRPRRCEPLAPGQLRALVLAHLRAWPDLDFSPTELARVLGRPRSRGAVINICRRLVAQGFAVRAQTAPPRYRAADTAPPPREGAAP